MTARLHVGNLPYSVSENELRELFSQAGNVVSVSLPTDRMSGRPRGFGFVEMESPEQADEAMKKFNGYEMDGRSLRVDMAREREERSGYGQSRGPRTGYNEYGSGGRGKQQGGSGKGMAA